MSNHKILIIDDDAKNIFALTATLRSRGYESTSATSAEEGIRMAAADPLTGIILLDMMMPGTLDGLEVCCRIKTSYDLRHTLVVLLTARDSAEDREAGFNAGADEYLVKPFSPTRLLQILASLERSD